MCSNSDGSTLFHIGSKIKSIPSLRANFAAGTKSLSPDIKTILSTNRLSASEAMSTHIFMSMPFCLITISTSFSESSSNFFSPLNSSFVTDGFITHSLCVLTTPNLNASFL